MNDIDDYLALYQPEVRAVANELRALIKESVPGVQEALYHGWQLIGYRVPFGSTSRYFCYIAPYEDHIRLGFEWGVLMAGEKDLLGSGTQVRHLEFKDTADLQSPLIAAYLSEASEVATLSKEQKANLALQRQAERERPSP